MGAWAYFHDTELLSSAALAALSGLLREVRDALREKALNVVLSNIDIAMDHLPVAPNTLPFALLVGTGSLLEAGPGANSQARSLTDCLVWQTRHVTLLPVDVATILEASFRYETPRLKHSNCHSNCLLLCIAAICQACLWAWLILAEKNKQTVAVTNKKPLQSQHRRQFGSILTSSTSCYTLALACVNAHGFSVRAGPTACKLRQRRLQLLLPSCESLTCSCPPAITCTATTQASGSFRSGSLPGGRPSSAPAPFLYPTRR